jgi:hypothetical protein
LGYPQYEVIKQYCYPQECPEISVFQLAGREHLANYDVRKPELGKYDGLLGTENGSLAIDSANDEKEMIQHG